MNIYAFFPLIATIAYIPLLVSTLRSRPWQRQHKLFTVFLTAAMAWSLVDYLARGNLFPQHNFLLFKIIVILYTWVVVQFYCFASSFFPLGRGRWLPLAYGSLAFVIALVVLGYVPQSVIVSGDKHYPVYGQGWVFIAIPLVTLLVRTVYVLWKRLGILDNPVLHNQISSLLISISVLAGFTFATLFLPWKEFPISHFGNLIVAFILSYATIQHQLVDIRFVLRRALTWTSLGVIGGATYWLLLVALHTLLRFELDFKVTFVATAVAVLVALFIYNLRSFLFARLGKAFHGRSYDYRQELSNFAGRIYNVSSLRE